MEKEKEKKEEEGKEKKKGEGRKGREKTSAPERSPSTYTALLACTESICLHISFSRCSLSNVTRVLVEIVDTWGSQIQVLFQVQFLAKFERVSSLNSLKVECFI